MRAQRSEFGDHLNMAVATYHKTRPSGVTFGDYIGDTVTAFLKARAERAREFGARETKHPAFTVIDGGRA